MYILTFDSLFPLKQIVNTLDVQETFEEWKRKNGKIGSVVNDQEHDNDDISVMTESGTITNMTLQTDLYQCDDQEELNVDTLKTIQTYLKKIYRGAKFLSDTGKKFKEPNFVVSYAERSQSVQICDYLWHNLGEKHI